MRSPQRLRKKIKAFRKRMLRKSWDELEDDIAALAVGQPKDEGK